MKQKILIISSLAIVACLFFSCAAGHISIGEAYNELRPVKQLELPEQVTDNLVITLENVADEGSSYKNRVELYVNETMVDPDWLVSNVQGKYEYRLKLRPGYYDLRAKYYAFIGWGEDDYEIISNDLVRVQHDQRTFVHCHIAKKPNGEPVNNTMYFETKHLPLDATTEYTDDTTQPVITENSDFVTMQIHTNPEHAKIIIDDKVVGQSPIKYRVNRNQDHVVQASAQGYRTKTKFFDSSKFSDEKTFFIILNLEK